MICRASEELPDVYHRAASRAIESYDRAGRYSADGLAHRIWLVHRSDYEPKGVRPSFNLLSKIAVSLVVDRMRREPKQVPLGDWAATIPADDPSEELDRREAALSLLQKVMELLGEPDRLFLVAYMEAIDRIGKKGSHLNVARMIGTTPTALRMRLSRIRTKVRRLRPEYETVLGRTRRKRVTNGGVKSSE